MNDDMQGSTGPKSVCVAVTGFCRLTEMFLKSVPRDEGSVDQCLRARNPELFSIHRLGSA